MSTHKIALMFSKLEEARYIKQLNLKTSLVNLSKEYPLYFVGSILVHEDMIEEIGHLRIKKDAWSNVWKAFIFNSEIKGNFEKVEESKESYYFYVILSEKKPEVELENLNNVLISDGYMKIV